MNIFRFGLDCMVLAVLTVLRAICAFLKGVLHYTYLGVSWIDNKIRKWGYAIEQTTSEMVFDGRHVAR